jgi:hypothetical protein
MRGLKLLGVDRRSRGTNAYVSSFTTLSYTSSNEILHMSILIGGAEAQTHMSAALLLYRILVATRYLHMSILIGGAEAQTRRQEVQGHGYGRVGWH